MGAIAIRHERDIAKEVVVAASRADVWLAWTTCEGVGSFFGQGARIELEPGGAYEIYFDLDAPPGSRGSEGMRVLSYLPEEMLSFEWNAPPRFPEARVGHERTWVVVRLDDAQEADATRVRLTHLGWREGGQWEQVREYFDRAWDTVLARLVQRFASGPLDWETPDPA
ncbi:MAG: SRPBCC family protein [Thermoleophilia bacterium]